MKIEKEQRLAAAELVDRSYQRGQVIGGVLVLASMSPPVLMLGYRASVNPGVTLGFLAAEATAIAVGFVGGGMLRRWHMRRQSSDAQPGP